MEKLKPEDISGAVRENESQIEKWTVQKFKFETLIWLNFNFNFWLKCRTRPVTAAGWCFFLLVLLFNALEYVWSFIIIPFYDRVLAFKAIPKYRDNVYDPDLEKSYTKVKLWHLESDKENVADNLSVSLLAKNPKGFVPNRRSREWSFQQ